MPACSLIPLNIIEDYVSFRYYESEELRARAIRNLFRGVGISLVFRHYYGAGINWRASGGSLVSKRWNWCRGDRLESAQSKELNKLRAKHCRYCPIVECLAQTSTGRAKNKVRRAKS